jgi:uncharacterized protein (DUF2062 family)
MNAPSPSPATTPPPDSAGGARSFWRRRLVDPVLAQLTQGVTPDRVAFTLALGTGLSLFPFLGFTALLNLGVGLWLRLNQPILQTLNQLLGPVHLVMIFLYVRLGERLWAAEALPFSVGSMIAAFRDDSLLGFLNRFGWAGVHAFTAWLVTLPFLVLGLQALLRPVIRRAASRLATARGAPAVSPVRA